MANGAFPLMYGSAVVNGQLVPQLTGQQVFPSNAYVPYYAGRGAPTPTIPPPASIGINAMGNANYSVAADAGAADPWSFAKSPVPWAIIFLVVGLVGLRHVHWRG